MNKKIKSLIKKKLIKFTKASVKNLKPLFWAYIKMRYSKNSSESMTESEPVVLNTESPKILIIGGYGFGNIGDEAQMLQNIVRIEKKVPNAKITICSPRPDYTETIAPGYNTLIAPRVVFWKLGKKPHYSKSDKVFQKWFFNRTPLYLFSCILMKYGINLRIVSREEYKFLKSFKKMDLIYYSGGGYLTGMTLSRLWDNILIFKISEIFNIPLVLSGQQIGVFKDEWSQYLARWTFKIPKIISLRDPIKSKEDLKDIGVSGDHIVPIFDDALFSSGATRKEIQALINDDEISKKYIALNIHHWGQSLEQREIIISEMAKAISVIWERFKIPFVFTPMIKSDMVSYHAIKDLTDAPIKLIDYNFKPKLGIGLIKQAHMCLTFKHHPIIFACGGDIPTVAIFVDDYYAHKNCGALKLFGIPDMFVDGRNNEHKLSEGVIEKVSETLTNHTKFSDLIESEINILREQEGYVINQIHFNP